MSTFRLYEDSLQERFLKSTAKVQVFGGGFANGKTSAACIKALEFAKDYPGSNGLIARSTYPKLNDTIRKEFLKWCPQTWIKSFPKSQNASNTCTLTNGTEINFRYIAQQGKGSQDSTTSNLLSATYDWIIVDQMEDPEIVHKDFLDLLGRLRGMTRYEGMDSKMPRTGPRQFILTCNPTRGWVYKKLVKPLQDFEARGIISDDLMCEMDEDGSLVRDENNRPIPILDLFEGSTYENKENLEADFIQTLESTYRGQMRDRYLLGKWAAYEGLVYPSWEEAIHVLSHDSILNYFRNLRQTHKDITILEGYDYGMAVPACYMWGFADSRGNVFLVDGWYEKELSVDNHIELIKAQRAEYTLPQDGHLLSDPAIFRRSSGNKNLVGKSISSMFLDDDIFCVRGNNDIANGIVKVSQYLQPIGGHENPILGTYGSPHLYVSDKLEFFIDEINDYYWRKDTTGDVIDKPKDKNDHAMDTIKYMLSHRPEVAVLVKKLAPKDLGWRKWGERDIQDIRKKVRYGRRSNSTV